MATTTFLGNATVNITYNATTTDFSDQATSCTLTIQKDALESTAFGDAGHTYAAGLDTVELEIEMFLSYGAGEVEALVQSYVGNTVTAIVSPSGTTESASNPEYTVTGYVESATVINSSVGELATLTLSIKGGTWDRDVT